VLLKLSAVQKTVKLLWVAYLSSKIIMGGLLSSWLQVIRRITLELRLVHHKYLQLFHSLSGDPKELEE
jgi:hypothetical protein